MCRSEALVFSRFGQTISLAKPVHQHHQQRLEHPGDTMARKPTGWNPTTHRLVNGQNWRIGRNRDAMVALRGRNGTGVEEIRLVDRSRSRHLDWASNIIVVKVNGALNSETESKRLYELCRAWWMRHTQINDLGARAFFQVELRKDGAYYVALELRGKLVMNHSVVLKASDPRWEWWGIRLLDAALGVLSGNPVDGDFMTISLDAMSTHT